MSSYININQKGCFCFQHLFNIRQHSTFGLTFNLDINRPPHLPRWNNSTLVEGDVSFLSDSLGDEETDSARIPLTSSTQVRDKIPKRPTYDCNCMLYDVLYLYCCLVKNILERI